MIGHPNVYDRLRELLNPALSRCTAEGYSWPAAVAFSALDLDTAAQRRAVELCIELGWCEPVALNDPEDALREPLVNSPTLPPGHLSTAASPAVALQPDCNPTARDSEVQRSDSDTNARTGTGPDQHER